MNLGRHICQATILFSQFHFPVFYTGWTYWYRVQISREMVTDPSACCTFIAAASRLFYKTRATKLRRFGAAIYWSPCELPRTSSVLCYTSRLPHHFLLSYLDNVTQIIITQQMHPYFCDPLVLVDLNIASWNDQKTMPIVITFFLLQILRPVLISVLHFCHSKAWLQEFRENNIQWLICMCAPIH